MCADSYNGGYCVIPAVSLRRQRQMINEAKPELQARNDTMSIAGM